MARPPKWSPEQKAEAIRLYLAEGITAAARQSGIPIRTIRHWTKDNGVSLPTPKVIQEAAREVAGEVVLARTGETPTPAELHDAVLSIDAKRQLKRGMILLQALDKAEDVLTRMDQPHEDFIGTKDSVQRVEYKRAPARAVLAYAQSFEILMRRADPGGDLPGTTTIQARIIDMVDERDRPVVQQVLDMALQIRRERREQQQLGQGGE